jgi:two-component system cell cycle sensor histidine kinase/response regulator CckA
VENALAVLVVDDEPDLRAIMQRVLTMRGYRVMTAGGVAEAVDAAEHRADPPDLLVTDVRMADGLGTDLARRLRERWPGLPVLFVSGLSRDRASAEGLIDDGFLLEKPFNPRQLSEAAAEALASRQRQ